MSLESEAIWAASPNTTRGQPTILSTDAKGERIAYASHKSIFVRSIDNPAVSRQYTQHTAPTTVARFSPSGFYVASGDASGTVRVWDCVGEGVTKGDYHIVSGPINDIAWDGDSQRIIAVGNGKERFGHAVTWDSGNSIGEISGHSSQINSVSIRQQRPLRAVTGGDDTSLVFYHGVPFKFNTSLREQHNRYVFGTAFSPDGSVFVSVGADKKIWLYDGRTGEAKSQIGEGVHTGSIFGVSWASDSKRFVTASADQTVRVWDAEAGKNIHTWRLGEEGMVSIPHQQMGVVWPAGRKDGLIISVDLEGNLNYLIESSPKPIKIIRGHQKNITATTSTQGAIITGGFDGKIRVWDTKTGLADDVDGETHTNYVSGLTATEAGTAQSVGWDDTLRSISLSAKTFAGSKASVDGQPRGVAVVGSTTLVATTKDIIQLFVDGKLAGSTPTKSTPTAIAAADKTVAVGFEDNSVRIFSLASSNTLTDAGIEVHNANSPITALAFSAEGKHLAIGTGIGKISVYSTSGDWPLVTDRWSAHSGRVLCIAWDETGERAASGSLDTNVFLWTLSKPGQRVKAANAHKDGVNGVAWSGDKILSAGSDGTVKVWKVV